MARVTWQAVDAAGRELATGGPPRWPGWPDPAAALAAAPVVSWPMAVVADDGARLTPGQVLGPGGEAVEHLLATLVAAPTDRGADGQGAGDGPAIDPAARARATPAGPVHLPLAVVDLAAGVEASAVVDPTWLGEVERRRSQLRQRLEEAGRGAEMEAALHVTMLLGAERLDPADDTDVHAHVASGARLWLLAGAAVSALAGDDPDPFAAWAELVVAGWWPVGPSGGRLVVSSPGGLAAAPRSAVGAVTARM